MIEILKQNALATLRQNLQPTSEGDFFVAGGNQFRTLWVRDFCYSVPGLLKAGFSETVERQLKLILRFKDENGFLPRGIDIVSPKLRVLWKTFFPDIKFPLSYSSHSLKAEYLGEHQTPAFDSNLLFIKSACQLAIHNNSTLILDLQEIQELLSIYHFNAKNLISQPAYSDWQDSVRREGQLLLTQLLFLEVQYLLKGLGYSIFKDEELLEFEELVIQNFFIQEQGLFREQLGNNRLSLDSHILLISAAKVLSKVSKFEIFKVLIKSPLWNTGITPGIPVNPEYDSNDVSWTTKAVGLRHYHDGFYWGWLIAESYRLAKMMSTESEAQRIAQIFVDSLKNQNVMSEIYEAKEGLLIPVQRYFYRSENPFTWTAAKWLEALID